MGHGLLTAAAQAATALAGNGGAWTASARAAALAGLERTGLPGLKDEDWRFTPIASLDRAWNPAPRSTIENVEHGLEGLDAVEILLVDGWLAPVPDLPDGVSLVRGGADVEFPGEEFDKARAFEALNLASAPEPFVLQIDGVVERPIHLVHASTDTDEPKVASPCFRIEVGRSAQFTLVEDHVGESGDLVNQRVELRAAANARVEWIRLVRTGADLSQIASMRIRQERDSVVRVQAMTLGGALVRHDVTVDLDGENAECALHGLVVGEGQLVADNHSVIRHRAPRARSIEHFRNVLDGRSRAVFAGRVVVEESVVGTDAQQRNANLLLSDAARVDALPQLEIYNDDVKASHGSTLGRLDADSMFYLRSRGIDEATARAILTWAFANVVVEEISLAPIRALVRRDVFAHLPAAGVDESVLGDLA